jgi:hypothetical protein
MSFTECQQLAVQLLTAVLADHVELDAASERGAPARSAAMVVAWFDVWREVTERQLEEEVAGELANLGSALCTALSGAIGAAPLATWQKFVRMYQAAEESD